MWTYEMSTRHFEMSMTTLSVVYLIVYYFGITFKYVKTLQDIQQ